MKTYIKENKGFITTMVAIIVIRFVLLGAITVSGMSMDPTFSDGQKVIGVKYSKLSRFDVVSVNAPDQPGKQYLKRIVGLPGEKVEVISDQLYIDGQPIAEPFLDDYKKEFKRDKLTEAYAGEAVYQKMAQEATYFTSDFSALVPEGEYLVLGDNRLISHDSRSNDIGPIKRKDILSEMKLVYWPLTDISVVE